MKKVYLETFGCQMNVSDSERILTRLKSDGFEITSDSSAADVVLLIHVRFEKRRSIRYIRASDKSVKFKKIKKPFLVF